MAEFIPDGYVKLADAVELLIQDEASHLSEQEVGLFSEGLNISAEIERKEQYIYDNAFTEALDNQMLETIQSEIGEYNRLLEQNSELGAAFSKGKRLKELRLLNAEKLRQALFAEKLPAYNLTEGKLLPLQQDFWGREEGEITVLDPETTDQTQYGLPVYTEEDLPFYTEDSGIVLVRESDILGFKNGVISNTASKDQFSIMNGDDQEGHLGSKEVVPKPEANRDIGGRKKIWTDDKFYWPAMRYIAEEGTPSSKEELINAILEQCDADDGPSRSTVQPFVDKVWRNVVNFENSD